MFSKLNNTTTKRIKTKQIHTEQEIKVITEDKNALLNTEQKKLKTKYRFKYHTVIGILLCTSILCYLDISFLIVGLSKYNYSPNNTYF